MPEFLYVYRGAQRPTSPEAAQQALQKWTAWFRTLTESGHLKDPGQPLEMTGKVLKGKKPAMTDGPYAESKDLVCGYTVVTAKDLTQAAELSSSCPILEFGGLVEVRPIIKINP